MTRYLVSTQAVDTACWCGAPVLRALDEGLEAKVDVAPVDRAGEIAALLAGRHTYSLSPRSRYLIYRSAEHILAGDLKGTVHAQHRCTTYKQPPLIGAI